VIKLSATILVFTFVFVLVIGAMTVLGRARPLPEEIVALHLGDMCELPCWIGITPGKTRIKEARELFFKMYNLDDPEATGSSGLSSIIMSDNFIVFVDFNQGDVRPTTDEPNPIVTRIDLIPNGMRSVSAGLLTGIVVNPDNVDSKNDCCSIGLIYEPRQFQTSVSRITIKYHPGLSIFYVLPP